MSFLEPEISRDTAMKLWIEKHSDYAKEQLVLNNTGLIGTVLKSLNLNPLDEDLFATGIVGVVKAVNNFDPDKGFAFSTYAMQVVRNEVLMTFRKKRIVPSVSLDEPCKTGNESEILYRDTIADGKDFEEEIIANVHFKNAMRLLSKKERKVVFLRMDGKTQNQIADICGISQSQVSKISKMAYSKLKQ